MGSALLLSVLTIMVCVALIFNQNKLQPTNQRVGSTGSIGDLSPREAEEKYGKVNQTAAHEAKEGLFRRIFCRPCNTGYSRCATQAYSQHSGYYSQQPSYSTQSYAVNRTRTVTRGYVNQDAPVAITPMDCSGGTCRPVAIPQYQPAVRVPSPAPKTPAPIQPANVDQVVDNEIRIQPSL